MTAPVILMSAPIWPTAFAAKWSKRLGIPVRTLDSIEEVVRGADVAIGGTTRTDIVSREPWVKKGATFVSLGWYLGDRGQEIARMVTHHGRVVALILAATIALAWTARRLRAR